MRKIVVFIAVLLWISSSLFAQTKEVTGKVTGENGEPQPFATVKVKGSKIATSADSKGFYSIKASTGDVLLFTSSAFATKEVTVDGNTVDVVVNIKASSLNEVVVTGYSTQQRRNSSASIVKVAGDEVKNQPIASFEQLLQGKSPGLLIQSQSGQPGSAATVTIRGKGSVLGSTSPLYILDGIEISNEDFQSLNPSDFDNYSVLKDAIATSQYGSRGANGVIVVTSKKGASGKTKVVYDYQYGQSKLPTNKLRLMNSAEKIDYEINYDRPDGTNPFGWTTAESDSLSKIYAGWDKALFRKSITQQHQLSLSGGNDKTRFFASGSIFNQEGLVLNTGLDRYTGRINLDHYAGNFKINFSTYLGYSNFTNTNENDAFIGTPLNAIRFANPYVTPYLPDGSYNGLDLDLQGQPNALREQLENSRLNKQLKGVGVISIEYKFPFVKGLSVKTNWGIDYTNNNDKRYVDKSTYLGSQQIGGNGSFGQSADTRTRTTGTTSLSYTKQVNDHNFGISVFNEIVKTSFESFNYRGFGLTGAFKNAAGIIPGTATNGYIPTVGGFAYKQVIESYFGIADYGFKNKYFLTGTIRRDGSSRLAEGKKYTTFGGIGASWVMSNEAFLPRTNFLNDLKFKVSYGSSGNQGVGDSYEALEQFGSISYNGVGGLILQNLKKNNLTWEVRTTLNAGFEYSILKNKISGSAEYYSGTTDKLYLDRQISGTNGSNTILTNLGKLRNSGIELAINITPVKTIDFIWTIGANYTYNKSVMLQLDGTNENINGLSINRIGENPNSIFVVKYAGVDTANGDALYYKLDGKTKTNQYDPNDRVIVGTFDPTNFGGVNSSLNYKGIEISALLTFTGGSKIFNNDRSNVENPIYYTSSLSSELLTEWRKPGDVTEIPSSANNFQSNTSHFVESGNFVRLRNVMISYSFAKSLLAKAKLTTARIFLQGQNLKTWSNFKGWDPEIATGSLSGAQYPALKIITFGLSVGF